MGGRELDGLGLAVDFGDVKMPRKRSINEHCDHGFPLNDQDDSLVAALSTGLDAKL